MTEETANSAPSKQAFPGTTKILCDGLLVTSDATSFLWLTVSLVVIPVVLFFIFSYILYCIFVVPHFMCRYKNFITVFEPWVLIPWVCILVATLASAFMTAFTDPGILPRGVNPRAEIYMNGATDYGGEPLSQLVYHPNFSDILLGKEVVAAGKKIFIKYCGTCQIFRPPRASHCSYCDNCVEEFDHHCPWVSNCIGRRNFRDFAIFLLEMSMLIDSTAVLMIKMLYRLQGPQGFWARLAYDPVATFLVILCIPTGLLTTQTCLATYLLILRDKTTSENIKGYDANTGRNCLQNLGRVFCSTRSNRHVAWRDFESLAKDKKDTV